MLRRANQAVWEQEATNH